MSVHVLPPRPESPGDWRSSLTFVKPKGEAPHLSQYDAGNAALILANDPAWIGRVEYNMLAQRLDFALPPPALPGLQTPPAGPVRDEHIGYVQQWFAVVHRASFGVDTMTRGLLLAGHQHEVNPLQDYLTGLVWDGTSRLQCWLQTYFGAPDIPAVVGPGVWWMVAAVARAFQPGCQVDHMLVLEGPEGTGKTQALRILGGDWYLGNLPDLKHKDAMGVLAGYWIVEVGELDAFKRADQTHIKNWLTLTFDRGRMAYGRFFQNYQRTVVFAGTTNEKLWNKSTTGARRQWPIPTRGIRTDALANDKDQLWAEAVVRYRAGEHWYPDAGSTPILRAAQDDRHEDDAWESVIAEYLADQPLAPVTVRDLLEHALKITPANWTRLHDMRVADVLSHLGYVPGKRRRVGTALIRPWVLDGDE